MGYQRDGYYDHEGYALAFVERAGTGKGSGIYRELGYPDGDTVEEIVRLAAGCSCGWRSPMFRPRIGEPAPQWIPHIVIVCHHDEELVSRLWDRHIASDCSVDTKPTNEAWMRLPHDWREEHIRDQCRECLEHYGMTPFVRGAR